MRDTETSTQACERLNVSAQTLYAYVSRGLVRVKLHPQDSRKRLYFSQDIERLINRQKRGRSRQAVAQSTIDFGEPVLRSRISCISDGKFYYRGKDAVELSNTYRLEDAFELLCAVKIRPEKKRRGSVYLSGKSTPLARFIDALANQVALDKSHGNKNTAYALLRLMACNAAQINEVKPNEPIHELLARAWSSGRSPRSETNYRTADLIRRALVLSADHELNASTYTVRVTASAGASLPACLLSGIATLSGSYHGGLTDLCAQWMSESASKKLSQLELIAEQSPPGFGHRLYPNGDPRAIEILEHCQPPITWQRVAGRVVRQTGAYPTLDYGLATLEKRLRLPKGAGFSIFAVGRTVGWLAHIFEQRKYGTLIRPRAS